MMVSNKKIQFVDKSEFTFDDWEGGKILACFARSFDNNREEFSNNIHLICSVFGLNFERECDRKEWRQNRIHLVVHGLVDSECESDNENVINELEKNCFLDDLQNYTTSVNNMFKSDNDDYYQERRFIFHVFITSDIQEPYKEYVNYNGKGEREWNDGNYIIRVDGSLISIFINIDILLENYRYNLSDESKLFKNIFGLKNDKTKNMDNIWNNSLFVFYNIYWFNVVLRFKYNGIDISGGSISKRHVLTSSDYKLCRNLNDIYGYDNKLNQVIHSNLKEEFLSSSIPEVHYKEYLENISKEYSARLNKVVYNTLFSKEEEKERKIISNFKDKYLNYKESLETFNYMLGLEILYKSILDSYKKIIMELKKNYNKDEKYLLRDGPTTISMQNILIKQQRFIEEKEKEFSDFQENIEKLNISDLFKLNEQLNRERFGLIKKFNQLKKFTIKKKYKKDRILGFRGYSTQSTLENNCESFSVAVESNNGIEENEIENGVMRKEFLMNSTKFGMEIFKIVNKAKGVLCEETQIKILRSYGPTVLRSYGPTVLRSYGPTDKKK